MLAELKARVLVGIEALGPQLDRQDESFHQLQEAAVARGPCERQMKSDVELELLAEIGIGLLAVAAGLVQILLQLGDVRLGEAAGREQDREQNEGIEQQEDLGGIARRPFPDAEVARLVALDDPELLEPPECVAHRSAADTEPRRDVALDERLARGDHATLDRLEKLERHPFRKAAIGRGIGWDGHGCSDGGWLCVSPAGAAEASHASYYGEPVSSRATRSVDRRGMGTLARVR